MVFQYRRKMARTDLTTYVFLGPVSFLNHSCKANVEWYSIDKSLVTIKTLSDILAGDELTELRCRLFRYL